MAALHVHIKVVETNAPVICVDVLSLEISNFKY